MTLPKLVELHSHRLIVGTFSDGRWKVDRRLVGIPCLYTWDDPETGTARLGHTECVCDRHGNHNAHYRGSHGKGRPSVLRAAEATRRLLKPETKIGFIPFPNGKEAEQAEDKLRVHFGRRLFLDISVAGSLINEVMRQLPPPWNQPIRMT